MAVSEVQRLAKMDATYLTESRRVIYTACEDLEFQWDEADVLSMEHMWNSGLSITDIAKALDRDVDEVAILVIDRARLNKIGSRKGGVFGVRRVVL